MKFKPGLPIILFTYLSVIASGRIIILKNNEEKFGRLHYLNTDQKVCPSGWHLPDNSEWITLINFYGGKTLGGSKLKAGFGWNNPENEALINLPIGRPDYKDTLDLNGYIKKFELWI